MTIEAGFNRLTIRKTFLPAAGSYVPFANAAEDAAIAEAHRNNPVWQEWLAWHGEP